MRSDSTNPSKLSTWGGWLVFAVLGLLAAGLRFVEWRRWQEVDLWFMSAPLLPSADAYAWLAGALGSGRMAGWPLALFIDWLSRSLALDPRWLAFWLPMFLAPATGFLVALICFRVGYRAAGLLAGIVATCSLGFLARTRLGYADTDLFALPMAIAFAWACAELGRFLRVESCSLLSRQSLAARVAAVSILFWGWMLLYPSGYPIALAILATLAGYGLAVTRRFDWGTLLIVVCVIVVSGHLGWAGLVVALAFLFAWYRSWLLQDVRAGAFLLAGVLGLIVHLRLDFLAQSVRRVSAYIGFGPEPVPVSDWRLPSVDDSIQEATLMPFIELAERTGGHWLILSAGLVGFVVVVRRWSWFLVFTPLLVLGLSSFFLGNRFAMYAGPVLGIGLGLGLALALQKYVHLAWMRTFGIVLVSGIVVVYLGSRAFEVVPETTLHPSHAASLKNLGASDNNQGRVWSWWDEGYPTQYYSGLPTLADGGNASRQRIFMLGRVFGANSSQEAAHLLRIASRTRDSATINPAAWRDIAYRTQPLDGLGAEPAERVEHILEGKALLESDRLGGLPDEFLVVSWMTLRKSEWVSYFGRWSLIDGDRGHGRMTSILAPVQLDEINGLLHTPNGIVPLSTLDILESGTRYTNQWPHEQGAHAVINNDRAEGVLMDSALYRMMAVQMLIGDPRDFSDHFELVSDAAPAARIYRLR